MRSEEGGDPMTVEEMKKKKTELGFSCEQISDRSIIWNDRRSQGTGTGSS